MPQSPSRDKSRLRESTPATIGRSGRRVGRPGAADQGDPVPEAPEEKPQHDRQTLEAFDEEGAGIAPRE